MNEMERVLDDLENLIMDAFRIPLINKYLIDPERLGQIMDAIRTAVPVEIKQARQLLNDRERHRNEAMEEKQRIIKQAEFTAEKMISEEEIVRQAKEFAEEIRRAANEEAFKIRSDTEEYAQKLQDEALEFANKMHEETNIYVGEIFEYIEATLDKTAEAVQKSKEFLNKKARGET
ncbi:MAG: hypothetical protein LBO03_01490 [Acidaminococcales bacterium]|jgi:cell division septum initiation protein DivIVA|nr:hypothetical protein [Acidaminococcales bacterium]